MNSIKRLVALFFVLATLLLVIFYVPACFAYVVSPRQWWPMGVLNIGFPYLWLCIFIFVIAWLFRNKKVSLILFALFIAGFPIGKNLFALNKSTVFNSIKKPSEIRIMQWNCMGLQGTLPYYNVFSPERFKAVAFIKAYQPDIICIQDFSEVTSTYTRSNIKLLQDTLGYPYHVYTQHFCNDLNRSGYDGIGIAIFSRYPIFDSGRLRYPKKVVAETILWANFNVNGKVFRVATTHLQSMHLTRDKKMKLEKDLWEDSALIAHGNKLEKLRYFQPYHVTQAEYLKAFLDSSKLPLVFTADLNSVPSSFVYKTVRSGLTDAFLAHGFGFGRTYHSLQPALRIDYIFHNSGIQSSQTSLFRTTFSDHDPLITDFLVR